MRDFRIWCVLLLTVFSPNLYAVDLLSDAISGENVDRVRTLIEDFGVDINKAQSVDGQSIYPLLLAAKTGNRDLVRLLLAHGANVDQVNLVIGTIDSTSDLFFEETALSYSASKIELLSIAHLLLQAKASPWILLHKEARWLENFETYKLSRKMKITLLDSSLYYPTLLFGATPAKFSITYPNDDIYTYLNAKSIAQYKKMLLDGHKPSDFEVSLIIHFGNIEALKLLSKLGYWSGDVDETKFKRIFEVARQFDTYFVSRYNGTPDVFANDGFAKELASRYSDLNEVLSFIESLPATVDSESSHLSPIDVFFPSLPFGEDSINFIKDQVR